MESESEFRQFIRQQQAELRIQIRKRQKMLNKREERARGKARIVVDRQIVFLSDNIIDACDLNAEYMGPPESVPMSLATEVTVVVKPVENDLHVEAVQLVHAESSPHCEVKAVEITNFARRHQMSNAAVHGLLSIAPYEDESGCFRNLSTNHYEEICERLYGSLVGTCEKLFYCGCLCTESYIGALDVDASALCRNCNAVTDSSSSHFMLGFNLRETLLNLLQRTVIGQYIIDYASQRSDSDRCGEYGQYFSSLSAQPSKNNIPLLLSCFSDAYQQYQRSQTSVWVQCISIDNLPLPIRLKVNIPLLFIVKSKNLPLPPASVLLAYFSRTACCLAEQPLDWTLGTETMHSRIVPYLYAADTPERNMVLELDGHSGFKSCPICRFEGTKLSGVTCFPTMISTSEPRTRSDFLSTNASIGVKRRTRIADVPMLGLNLPKTVIIDIMHCGAEGIIKNVLQKLVKACTNDKPDALRLLDDKFKGCSVPSQFKTSYVSIAKLATMPAKHLLFLGMVVEPMRLSPLVRNKLGSDGEELLMALALSHLMLVDEVYCEEFVELAENLMLLVVELMESLYSFHSVVYNFHIAQHLAEQRRLHGPLLAVSCFARESFNKEVKRSVHSGNHILGQVRNAAGKLLMVDPLTKKLVGYDYVDGPYGCKTLADDNNLLISTAGHRLIQAIANHRIPRDVFEFLSQSVKNHRLMFFKGVHPHRRSTVYAQMYWTVVLNRESFPGTGSFFFFTGREKETACYSCEWIFATLSALGEIDRIWLVGRQVERTSVLWMPATISSVKVPASAKQHYYAKGTLSSAIHIIDAMWLDSVGFSYADGDENLVCVTRISFHHGILS